MRWSLLVFALVGCTDLPCQDGQGENVPIAVDVEGGPVFTWEDGNVAAFEVSDADGTGVWQFQCDGIATNCIESGVIYGELPKGVHENTPLRALVPGATYTVGISRKGPVQGGCRVYDGEETFQAP